MVEEITIGQSQLAKAVERIELVCHSHHILLNLLVGDTRVYLRCFDVGMA